jgi:nucleotide-binding universal stress UspA family protein
MRMKLDTILVPLDGSTVAESALPKATELAETSGARLLLLRAAEAHTLPGIDPTEAQVKVVNDAEAYLAKVAVRLRAAGPRRVGTSVWYGSAPYAIVEAAQLHRADLIVMTTHGRSGLGRLIIGSVAESVLRGTLTPILLLRTPEAPVDRPRAKDELKAGPAPTRNPTHPPGVA